MSTLSVGSARGKITPRIGLALGGNARADNYSTGVLQDLYVRALWVERAGSAACILSLDLLGLWEADSRRVREAVAERLNLSPANVMVACTHTHSGPDTLRLFCLTDAKEKSDAVQLQPWLKDMTGQACEAAERARDRAAPATMCVQLSQNTEIPNNRRLRIKTGETLMNWRLPPADDVECALGPIDPQVTVVTFKTSTGIAGGLIHFACHPAILAGLNMEFSGDYCGFAMDQLEHELAPDDDTSFLFLNGALGNINHIDYFNPDRGRDIGEVRRCATSLVRSVETAIKSVRIEGQGDPDVAVAFVEALTPLRSLDPEEVEEARQIVARYDGRSLSLPDGVPAELNARRVFRLQEAALTGKYPGPFATMRDGKVVIPLQVIRIGNLVLAGAPGEMFVEYGLQLKERLDNKVALLVSVANGYAGYIPTPEAFGQGGYEPSAGPGFVQPETGNAIIKSLIQMEKQTHGS